MKIFNSRSFFFGFFLARANQKIRSLALGRQSKTGEGEQATRQKMFEGGYAAQLIYDMRICRLVFSRSGWVGEFNLTMTWREFQDWFNWIEKLLVYIPCAHDRLVGRREILTGALDKPILRHGEITFTLGLRFNPR
jgi:hypothetical protein